MTDSDNYNTENNDAMLHGNDNVNYMKVTEYIWNEDIDKEDLLDLMKNIDKPIVIRGLFKETAAYNKWNLENIGEIFGSVPLEVKMEESEVKSINKWEHIDYKPIMKNLVNYLKYNDNPNLYVTQLGLNDLNHTHSKLKLSSEVIYDITLSDILEDYEASIKNALYFGKDASTEFHIHMVDDYILNQLIGKKDIYLCDLYKNQNIIKSKNIHNYIGIIDPYGYPYHYIENNEKKYRFLELDHSLFDELYKITLNPGDSLFIPPWWWHATEGKDINLSITTIIERDNINYFMDYPDLAIKYYFSSGTGDIIYNLTNENINFSITTIIIFIICLFFINNNYKYISFLALLYVYIFLFIFLLIIIPNIFKEAYLIFKYLKFVIIDLLYYFYESLNYSNSDSLSDPNIDSLS